MRGGPSGVIVGGLWSVDTTCSKPHWAASAEATSKRTLCDRTRMCVVRQGLLDANQIHFVMKRLFLALLILFAVDAAMADDERFTVVRVNTESENLQMFWADEHGKPFQRLDRLSIWLEAKGKKLVFGMNAGMYHADSSPVGLLVLNAVQVTPLNLSSGPGNFFLKPNGVFLLTKSGPRVVDATAYASLAKDAVFATQSGPLLLRSGAFHPALNPASTSRLIRNGVGVSGKMAVFVISEVPVSFYELAVFFRDVLHCQDALYLDGVVSSLYSEALGRGDHRANLGPVVGVVQ